MQPRRPLGQEEERPSSLPRERKENVLWRWVGLSGLLHIVMIGALFFSPQAFSRGAVSYPVYTVDLVSGEKIGGGPLNVGIKPAPVSKKPPKKVKKKSPSRAPKKEKVKKAKRRTQVVSVKKEKKKIRRRPKKKAKKSASKTTRSALLKKSEKRVKRKKQTGGALPTEVRKKLIQAALEKVKQRTEKAENKKSEAKEAGLGPGEGQGAAGPRPDGRGGGIFKGVEFLIYRNRMLHLIKERWTWVGKRTDLEVTVRFGIRENGEVIRLRVVDASEDPSYDDSVMRAVRRASPLPPTPDSYRKDFMDVELTFRPGDLGG